jgi:hypothetical protein
VKNQAEKSNQVKMEGQENASEDMFGDVNALLNVIEASETDKSEQEPSSGQEKSEIASGKEENMQAESSLEGKNSEKRDEEDEIRAPSQDEASDSIDRVEKESENDGDEHGNEGEPSLENVSEDAVEPSAASAEAIADETPDNGENSNHSHNDDDKESVEVKDDEKIIEISGTSDENLEQSQSEPPNPEHVSDDTLENPPKTFENPEATDLVSEDIEKFLQSAPSSSDETSQQESLNQPQSAPLEIEASREDPSVPNRDKSEARDEEVTESANGSVVEGDKMDVSEEGSAKLDVNKEEATSSEADKGKFGRNPKIEALEHCRALHYPNDSSMISDKKRSESPNDLIDMLKKLSPEKLEEIKAKIFENDQRKKLEFEEKKSEEKMEVDEAPPAVEAPKTSSDDCVILLDSDEEDSPPKPAEETPKEPEKEKEVATASKRKSDEVLETKAKQPKNKECVNPDCPRESKEFSESPLFVLSFYFATKKPNKTQFVCSSCYEKALTKYEELSTAMMNNLPMCDVKIHKKHEMVEVIDSDDEDGQNDLQVVPDSEKFVFNAEVEAEVENILQDLCNKVDFKKQLAWDEGKIKKGLDDIDLEQSLFEEKLKKLEKMSSTMYNELYSINRPKIQRRPSVDLSFEFEPPKLEQINRPSGYPPPGMKVIINPPVQASPKVAAPAPAITSPRPTSVPLNAPFALRSNIEGRMQNWSPCKLLEKLQMQDGTNTYRVQFMDTHVTLVNGKEFAPSNINLGLTIGARVIALFSTKLTRQGKDAPKKFLPGVIGEKRSKYNKFRYLVFCDYGQVQYVSAEDVREIAEASPNVVDDVHRNLKQFIQDYLHSQTQGQRPLLNVRLNQQIYTERNSKWQMPWKSTAAWCECCSGTITCRSGSTEVRSALDRFTRWSKNAGRTKTREGTIRTSATSQLTPTRSSSISRWRNRSAHRCKRRRTRRGSQQRRLHHCSGVCQRNQRSQRLRGAAVCKRRSSSTTTTFIWRIRTRSPSTGTSRLERISWRRSTSHTFALLPVSRSRRISPPTAH